MPTTRWSPSRAAPTSSGASSACRKRRSRRRRRRLRRTDAVICRQVQIEGGSMMKTTGWSRGLAIAAIAATLQAASAQETRLFLTSLSPAGSPNSQFFNAWAKRVSDASQGTLRVEVRDGVTLANFSNSYDRTMDDVVQIGWVQHSFVAGKFPLSEITTLPFVSDDNVGCSAALWRLYKSGVIDVEYKEAVPIWFGCLGQSGLHF